MTRPAFLDRPDAWTRAMRDSRGIALHSTAYFGPYRKPTNVVAKVTRWAWAVAAVVCALAAVVVVGAVALGGA